MNRAQATEPSGLMQAGRSGRPAAFLGTDSRVAEGSAGAAGQGSADAAFAAPETAPADSVATEVRGSLSRLDGELLDLMPQVVLGCTKSFARLYSLTSRPLFGIVLRINAVRPEAEEVLQETFVRVWAQRAQFDAGRGKAMVWLAAIARYRAIDSLRMRNRLPLFDVALCVDEVADDYGDFVSACLGPLEAAIRLQQAQAVARLLGVLADGPRQSLMLAFHEGLSHSEIARRLGRPVGTVKSWLRRAFADLRPALEGHR
jgi:RNA polymerase sigma-70 factor (ECF subfamily)